MKLAVRNVIQIASSTVTSGDSWQGVVVALCDDGTIWTFADDGLNTHWVAMPEIPQHDFTFPSVPSDTDVTDTQPTMQKGN